MEIEKKVLYDAFLRACMYLQKGYEDKTEKNDFTVMQWEEFLLKEAEEQC